MAKRVGSSGQPSKARSSARKKIVKSRKIKKPEVAPQAIEVETRLERLIDLIDLCTAGKAIADTLDETFLAYLLAMAIQEARSNLRRMTIGTDPLSPSLSG